MKQKGKALYRVTLYGHNRQPALVIEHESEKVTDRVAAMYLRGARRAAPKGGWFPEKTKIIKP